MLWKYDICNPSNMAMNVKSYFSTLTTELDEYPLHDLLVVKRKTYDIEANWKLLMENFLDYYHLNAIHPELVVFDI